MTDDLPSDDPRRPTVHGSPPLEGGAPNPRAGRRDRQQAAMRTRIVEAAFEVFWAKGYATASVTDIADRAGISVGTFSRQFRSKAHVAVEHTELWLSDFIEAMKVRPGWETPDQMVPAALAELAPPGYASGLPVLDEAGRPVPTISVGILLAGISEEIAGRMHQLMMEAERALSALFARRLGYSEGALEPRFIAAGIMAGFRVSTYGFLDVLTAGSDLPSSDEVQRRCGVAFTEGLQGLWTDRPASARTEGDVRADPPGHTRSR